MSDIVEHIPLHERLTSCALVCQKFHAAAVAATEDIEAILREQLAVDNFMEYLQQYGSHLTGITVTGYKDEHGNWPVLLEQLPCPQLYIQASCSRLTHLDLHCATVMDEGGVSGGMFLLEWLPKLQHLEYLRLSGAYVNWPPRSPAFQPLVASCSKLRTLDIGACNGVLAHTFPHSPSHDVVLTSLEVLKATDITQEAVLKLVRCCPALMSLTIESQGGDHLTALSQLSALTTLKLSLQPGGGGATSTEVAIEVVAGLTRLQDLSVWLPPPYRTQASWQDVLPLTLRQATRLDVTCLPARPLMNKVGVLNPPCADCMGDKSCRCLMAWNTNLPFYTQHGRVMMV